MEDNHSFYKETDFLLNQRWHTSFGLLRWKRKYYVNKIHSPLLAKEDKIELGDEILTINGLSTKHYEQRYLSAVNGSNRSSKNRELAAQLFRTDTAKRVYVKVKRRKDFKELLIKRYPYDTLLAQTSITRTPLWKEMKPGIWYVDYCKLTKETELQQIFEAISSAKGVIWDLRGYPDFDMVSLTMPALMPDSIRLGFLLNADLNFLGSFTKKEELYSPISSRFPVYKGKMVVLVNEQTQSLAESVSAQLSLRKQTRLMGRQTAGTTGNVSYFPVPGGIKVSFTAVGFEGEKRSFVQKKGVRIDDLFPLSRESRQSSEDLMLRAALKKIARSSLKSGRTN